MEYRHLGRSGLKLSVLSFGSWVTFGSQLDRDGAAESLRVAHDAGVNFFDNAEVYAGGESERIMGHALRELGWPRYSYVVSTKFFWGIDESVNTRNTLNRKYLMHAIEGSLERLQLDFVDLVFCHRPDFETPVEETVWAMHDIIDRGKAHYWGTSEWPAERILAAHRFATDNHLHAPLMEQPQYNLLARERVEVEYAPLYEEIGLGLTVWSPLASGVLTGKYLDGIPADSRLASRGYSWLRDSLLTPASVERVRRLKAIADHLGVPLALMSLAWCARNPHVSTVITGASRPEQVHENMQALDVIPLLTADVLAEIDAAVA
ncbi:MAG TPA: aldo/keto reductase [Candidatus Dormibacteraeota bacterium]|nr:aldo/keto reductase [Candidatus Dormibacteraeota bacterium]